MSRGTDEIQQCKDDFRKKLEGEIRQYCIRTYNRENVFILDKVLRDYVNTSITFISFGHNLVVISAKLSDVITVTGLGRFTRVAAGGGAAGAAAGVVGGGGAGAGIGAAIGIIGGPIGVGIGAAVGAGVGAAVGGVGGSIPGVGVGGWIARRFGRDLQCKAKDILPQLGDVEEQTDTRIQVTVRLDATN